MVEEAFLNAHPLLAFSLYTHVHVEALKSVHADIVHILDESVCDEGVDASAINKVYGLFWLWVLGAFEVIRTMEKSKNCFTPDVYERLKRLKSYLIRIRAPFAKHEFAGRSKKIYGELSITSLDHSSRDFSFSIDNEKFTVREVMAHVLDVLRSIQRTDILDSLEKRTP